jgi:hypothetical protein
VSDFLAQHDLNVLNEGSVPTFETIRGTRKLESYIDITACSNALLTRVENWRVCRDAALGSDHNAIVFSLQAADSYAANKTSNVNQQRPGLFKTSKANWIDFGLALISQIQDRGITVDSLDSVTDAHELENIVKEWSLANESACESTMVRSSGKGFQRKSNPWWSPKLDTLKTAFRVARTKFRNSGVVRRPFTRQIFEAAKNKYETAIAEAKLESWKSHCSAQGKENVWSSLQRLLKSKAFKPPETLTINGRMTSSALESAEALLGYFFPDDNIANETEQQTLIRNAASIPSKEDDDENVTLEEVERTMRLFNPAKAPGHDSFTADICLNSFLTVPSIVVALYNAFLRIGHFPKIWKVGS